MKNKNENLKNHLFLAIENIMNPETDGLTDDQINDKLKTDIEKAQAVASVGKVIIDLEKIEFLQDKLNNGPVRREIGNGEIRR